LVRDATDAQAGRTCENFWVEAFAWGGEEGKGGEGG